MELIADALLIAGALGAALYCRALGGRLAKLRDLDSGLGAAIAALSRQVDELRASLETVKDVSGGQTRELAQLAARAEMAAGRLELLLASLHEGGRRKPDAEARRRARWPDGDEEAGDPAEAPHAARAAMRRAFSNGGEGRDDAAAEARET